MPEIERTNRVVEMELCSRLNVGGRWYLPGSTVNLDAADAAVYESRGLGRIVIPKKAALLQPAPPPRETVNAQQLGVVTKDLPPVDAPSREAEDTQPKEKPGGRSAKSR